MQKWLLRGVLAIVALVALAFGVGVLLPASHVAIVETRYKRAPDAVWEELVRFESWGEWNTMVERMERVGERDGRDEWINHGEWGEMPTLVLESQAPSRLVTEVDGGAFKGTWTYEIEPDGAGTRLRITERGEIPFPPFRLFSLGRDNTESARLFLVDLGRHFGEATEPEILP